MYSFNTKEWAKFWRVSVRTTQNWGKDGYPVDKPLEMAALIISKNLGGKNCLAKAQEIVLRKEGRIANDGNDSVGNSPLVKKEAGTRSSLGFEAYTEEIVDKRHASAYFWGKMKEAAATGNLSGETYYHERYLKNEAAIKADELHAKKMGLDEGAIINRESFERYVFALAFWMVRSVEMDLRSLSELIVELPNQEVAWGVLERHFMRKRFLSAFEKASVCDAGVSLPKWCFEGIRDAVDTFFEVDGVDEDDLAAYEAFQSALTVRRDGRVA